MRAIENFKGKKLKIGMHPNTLRHILTLLKSILRYAHSLEFVLRVPSFKMPKVPESPYKYIRTESGIRAFLRAAKDDDEGVFEFYATAVYTGMRAGELVGLMWDDVDALSGWRVHTHNRQSLERCGMCRFWMFSTRSLEIGD